MARVSESEKLLDVIETLLRAQLEAVEELRSKGPLKHKSTTENAASASKPKSMSQTSMAHEVLLKAGQPLHILEVVRQIQETFGITVNRDTLVSAILKKVAQGKQFVKTGKNTYGLLSRDEP